MQDRFEQLPVECALCDCDARPGGSKAFYLNARAAVTPKIIYRAGQTCERPIGEKIIVLLVDFRCIVVRLEPVFRQADAFLRQLRDSGAPV